MLLYVLQTETVLSFLKQTQEPHDRKVVHVKVYKKLFFISQILNPLRFFHFDFLYYTIPWALEMS